MYPLLSRYCQNPDQGAKYYIAIVLGDGLRFLPRLDLMHIRKLPELIIAQIAAGEVIESPVSVIKELIENSIDAGATSIEILAENQGLTYIQIRDNGRGIDKEDLPLALAEFATSKLASTDDLFHVMTMGFRGEALSSIRSISKITIESQAADSTQAWKISAEGADISPVEPSSYPAGTRIKVENLFFNVPIRKKFISNEKRLRQQIIDLVTTYAIVNFNISFLLTLEGEVALNARPAASVEERIGQIYSATFLENMTGVYFRSDSAEISGLISGSGFYHSRSGFIKTFVNSRPVEFGQIVRLLKKVYGELLPPGKFPAAYLFINIDPAEIDVNVHPQKKEIRIREGNDFLNVLEGVIRRGIENRGALNLNRKLAPIIKKNEVQYEARPANLFDLAETIGIGATARKEYEVQKGAADSLNSRIEFIPDVIHTTLFKTMIVGTSADGLFLIDQHTAHERIQYEKYRELVNNRDSTSQSLVDAVSVTLSGGERDILEKNRDKFESMGFGFEDFGPAGIRVSAVPAYLSRGQEEEAIRVLVDLIGQDRELKKDTLFDKMVKSMSCRSAVKKGESVSLYDHTRLIEKLYKCKDPLRCPHGRPTVVFLSRDDIFRLFNRPGTGQD